MTAPLFPDHPERQALQAEAHARPPLSIPQEDAEVWHWVLTDADPNVDWAGQIDPLTRHKVLEVQDGLVRIERHTEFTAITFVGDAPPGSDTRSKLQAFNGQLLTGQRIIVRKTDAPDIAERIFHENRQFGGRLVDPDVRVRSDFFTGPDSMVDYLVEGSFQGADQRGQIVKWLIDLETYRTASLLALPMVRRFSPRLQALDEQAAELIRTMTAQSEENDRSFVDELAALLSETSRLREDVRYRIAASSAYYGLVRDRLAILKERPEAGRLTLEGFVEHRLTPGIKTVFAFERRLDALSQTIVSAMGLARTRLDHRLQLQNAELLASMDRRTHQQVHLAQAVEGLSVAAITYYIVSLIAKALESLPVEGLPEKLIVGVSIPLVALAVWLAARRARKAIENL